MKVTTPTRRTLAAIVAATAFVALSGVPASAGTPASGPGRALAPGTRFYVDPHSDASGQVLTDLRQGDLTDAATMAKLATWPEATWFTGGTPAQVTAQAHDLARRAAAQRAVPILVAYDIPLRDCSLYSAGGAQSDADYQAWIAALAAGLGDSHAVVIVEPDGLANLPSDCSATTDPTGTLTAGRIADIRYAVDVLEARPNVAVYLDAGNVGWRAVGDIANRLLQAGVQNAQGFMLNVSNYWPTDENDEYGAWVAKCMWFATQGPSWAIGHADYCASQYYSGAAPNDGLPGDSVSFDDPSTWHWTEAWYDQNVGTPPLGQLSHFLVDTSRNGIGPWSPPAGTAYPDAQTWCNPPDRGIGLRPTADTGVPLLDAYLWVKTIGESDGQCSRGEPGTVDPVYGSTDPAAGTWWPSMALTLAHNAAPPLTFNLG
jgi:endoglucanase